MKILQRLKEQNYLSKSKHYRFISKICIVYNYEDMYYVYIFNQIQRVEFFWA